MERYIYKINSQEFELGPEAHFLNVDGSTIAEECAQHWFQNLAYPNQVPHNSKWRIQIVRGESLEDPTMHDVGVFTFIVKRLPVQFLAVEGEPDPEVIQFKSGLMKEGDAR